MNECVPVDVLIVDDHELLRAGARRLLELLPRVGTITEVASGEAALIVAAERPIDIVLMDLNLPGISGTETSRRLLALQPQARIIMVTGRADAMHIREALKAGVRSYITKGSKADEISKALQEVLDGGQYLSPDVSQMLAMDELLGHECNPFGKLTTRENDVIQQLLQGKRNQQISSELHISEKTVSTHRTRAFEKLNISNAAELVRLAIRHGLWEDD